MFLMNMDAKILNNVLQTVHCCTSAPWVLPLAPPLRTLFTVQSLTQSIPLCICQALTGPLRRKLYQTPVSKHLLASTIVSIFSKCKRD